MPRRKSDTPTQPTPQHAEPVVSLPVADLASALAAATTAAINAARPQKKTTANRTSVTPWTPKNGEAKLKLKRKFFQHGMPIEADRLTNERIALINQLRPGSYCDGWIKVIRRRDKGIDLDYPIKTVAHRMKLVTAFGFRDLTDILRHCVEEGLKPKKEAVEDFD